MIYKEDLTRAVKILRTVHSTGLGLALARIPCQGRSGQICFQPAWIIGKCAPLLGQSLLPPGGPSALLYVYASGERFPSKKAICQKSLRRGNDDRHILLRIYTPSFVIEGLLCDFTSDVYKKKFEISSLYIRGIVNANIITFVKYFIIYNKAKF